MPSEWDRLDARPDDMELQGIYALVARNRHRVLAEMPPSGIVRRGPDERIRKRFPMFTIKDGNDTEEFWEAIGNIMEYSPVPLDCRLMPIQE